MLVPISWLREFVALPDDAEAIADRLAMLGFPVAGVERRPKISGVVIGKIAALEKHPNADRLLVAQVDVARDAPLTIATAATNVAEGQTIAVATIGARLPALTIEPRTMRGVASQGMMISAEELALPGDWFEDGIMQLEPATAPGIDVVELFGLDADVLDVEITANRPDAMSILGLARELAASYGRTLHLPPLANPGERARRSARASRSNRPTALVSSRSASTTCASVRRRPGCAFAWRSRDSDRSTISSTFRTTSCWKPDNRCISTTQARSREDD